MLRTYLLICVLFCGVSGLWGQVSGAKALINQKGTLASIPANCTDGELYFATDQTAGADIYGCKSNVWTVEGGGGPGGGVTSVVIAGTANQITVTGTCTVTTTGTCTLSIPSAFQIPGTINKLTLTQPASGATLTILNGKTVILDKTLEFTGTDGTVLTFPTTSATIARTDAAQTFTGVQTFVAPILGTPTSITLTNATGLPVSTGISGLGTGVGTFLATPSSTNLAAALTDETGSGPAVFSVSPALTGTPTAPTPAASDNSTTVPTTAYVTTAITNAINASAGRDLVTAATAAVLPNSPTYSNGVSGIGATLTSGSNVALVVDGYTCVLNDRILVKNQASALQNGIYYCSQVGTGILPWILTRAIDYDTPSDMNNTIVPVANNGTVNPKTSWIMTSVVATVGTDAVTFISFTPNGANIVTAVTPGAGLCHFAGSTQVCTSSAVVSADLNITTTTCTAPQVVSAISATGTATCTAPILTQNSQSTAYTTVLGDAGKQIYHPGADTTARTWTIDSNANVAYLTGTCITFINDTSGGVITIAITSDTLVLMGTGSTGSRSLAASNVATACKVTSTRWIISGSSGLT